MAWSCQVCTFRHEEEQSLFVACFVCASPRGSDDNSASGDPPPPYSSATASAQPQARPAARPEIEAAEQTTSTHFRKVGSKTLLTSSGRVALDLSEIRYFTLPCSVALLPEAAELTLTSHRLIIVSGDEAIVGELSGISGANVEPQSFLSRARPRVMLQVLGRAALVVELGTKFDAEKFSSSMHKAVDRKSWEVANKNDAPRRAVGLSGILKQHEREKRESEILATESFVDLEALMGKAREVVNVCERYQAHVLARKGVGAGSASDGGEEEQLRTILMSVGIKSPVTRDQLGNGQKPSFYEVLARELADFLLDGGHLSKAGGMLGLTDAYCLFNRARGLSLVSPADLAECALLLKDLNLGMSLKIFESGVYALVSDSHDDSLMCEKLRAAAAESATGAVTAYQVSTTMELPLTLAREHLKIAESSGALCRDEHRGVVSFFANRFEELHSAAFGFGHSSPQGRC